jgi:tricorn protease-like protein
MQRDTAKAKADYHDFLTLWKDTAPDIPRTRIVFGTSASLSVSAGIVLVENKTGQIEVYDLKTLEKRALLTFSYPITAYSFSADGKRFLVLTANQVAYTFDSQSLEKPESSAAIAP